MKSDTQSISILAAPVRVLDFVADGSNLPRWAIGFAKSVVQTDRGWMVKTGQGEVLTTIEANPDAGTVDFRMQPEPGPSAMAYARVVPNGAGSEFIFTQFQQEAMPDEVFDQLTAALQHELVAMKALLEVECPL